MTRSLSHQRRAGLWLRAVLIMGIGACLVMLGAIWYERLVRPGVSPADESGPVLDEEQRVYLWQVEHNVLVLGKYWLKQFTTALAQADEQALLGLLADDFRGEALRQPITERLAAPFATVVRQKQSGATGSPLDAKQFVAHLLEFRAPFKKPPGVKLNVKDLTPDRRDAFDGPWHGTGMLRMWGEVEPGQPREVTLHLRFTVPAPDKETKRGWLRSCGITQSQVAAAPRFLLKDVTRARGVETKRFHDNWTSKAKTIASGGVYLCDFNRDGILDMLVTDVKEIALYQGTGDGRFKDVTVAMGLPRRIGAPVTAFVDIDGDGWDDLILGGRVYRNMAGKTFVDYTEETNLRLLKSFSGIAVADFDLDGRLDLYVVRSGTGQNADWLSGNGGKGTGNKLYRNLGNWQFADVTSQSGTAGGARSTFSAVWLDSNNDGWPDLYVPNEFGKGVLLVNNGNGTFREQFLVEGPGDFGTMGITAGDIDNDGNIDLYTANMYSKTGSRIIRNLKDDSYSRDVMAKIRRFVTGSQIYLNRGQLKFEPRGHAWQVNDVGWAYGPALADLDNDGFLDVFATSGFMSANRTEPDG